MFPKKDMNLILYRYLEKEKGIQGAILRRGCHMTLDGEVGEERAYFIGPFQLGAAYGGTK